MTTRVGVGYALVMEKETWLPVVGYEGFYEVSDTGLIRGVERVAFHPKGALRRIRPRILKPSPRNSKIPYLVVTLSKAGVAKSVSVHSAVAEAHIGPRPPGFEILHFDGDATNNNASNLRYGTPKENAADRDRHGKTVLLWMAR